jgi:hypothetical protein
VAFGVEVEGGKLELVSVYEYDMMEFDASPLP